MSIEPVMEEGPGFPVEELREFYRVMAAVRELDLEAVRWQRQGFLPAYAPCLGQEAAQVGSGLALDTAIDFAFPTYREMGVAKAMRVDMVGYMATHLAVWHGGLYNAADSHFAPIQAVVAGSVLHAVGWALGAKLDGSKGVALAYFGDGASSQGDVHEAMNFAAIMQAPVVFFVQNNGWAISLPAVKQVAGESVAARASGYGIVAESVDGDDVLAVYAATQRAIAHARSGAGPALVEAITYRRGPHATSDDPGRYRTLEDERNAGPDPLQRFADYLIETGVADRGFIELSHESGVAEAAKIREGLEQLAPRSQGELFENVFVEATSTLVEQERRWLQESEHV